MISCVAVVVALLSHAAVSCAFVPAPPISARATSVVEPMSGPVIRNSWARGAGPLHVSAVKNDYDAAIADAKKILVRASETKDEDPDEVLEALENLEKLMREKRKAEPDTAAAEVLRNLTGDWRLIFTTGTKDRQKKFGRKINYFPIKAMQSFDATTTPMKIQNGIYFFDTDFPVLLFSGDFDFDLKKSKLEFDFDRIELLGLIKIRLGKGEAAQIGASTGLGSEGNTQLAKQGRQAFFNWVSADENIATARGGGGGLALWKRVKKD